MAFTELEPLLQKVACLHDNPDASDICEHVRRVVKSANTPTMAQGVCEDVIVLCNPKAWGDRDVRGYDGLAGEWQGFLAQLSQLAIVCRQRIFEHYAKVIGAGR